MYRKRKRLLRRFFTVLVCFSLALCQPCYSEAVYEITETELTQIEENERRTQEAMKNVMNDLMTARESLTNMRETLQESRSNLEKLNQQVQAQAESLRKSEREKELMIKIGVPVAVVAVAGAFIGGMFAGLNVGR